MCDNLVNNSISGQMKSKLDLLSNLKAFDSNLCERVTQLNANYVSLNSHELNDKSIELINCRKLLRINGNNNPLNGELEEHREIQGSDEAMDESSGTCGTYTCKPDPKYSGIMYMWCQRRHKKCRLWTQKSTTETEMRGKDRKRCRKQKRTERVVSETNTKTLQK